MNRVLIILCLVFAASFLQTSDAALEYVGGVACSNCHEQSWQAWQASHHDLAMAEAEPQYVLGDFDDGEFEHFGITTRFFMDEARYMVRTNGPDGKLDDFHIKYTFGAYPLQQYLVEFPGGRLQALDIAWDSRAKEQGGQRWFALHPDEKIDYEDVLHWTGPNLNWNYMCAECHSTNFEKKYDAESRTYSSSWSEIDVSCEACHGPASAHVAWASSGEGRGEENGLVVKFSEREGVDWPIDPVSKKNPAGQL